VQNCKKTVFLVVVVIGAFCIEGCSGQPDTYISKRGKFSFKIPEELNTVNSNLWDNNIEVVTLATASPKESPEAVATISLTQHSDFESSNFPDIHFWAQGHIDDIVRNHGVRIKEIKESSEMDIKGSAGLKVVFNFTFPMKKIGMRETFYMFFRRDEMYFLGFMSEENLHFYYENIFQEIFDSFEFSD